MSNEPTPGVIGSLPRTRPHRRSSKRAAPAGAPPVDTQSQEPAVVKAAAPPKARATKPAAPAKARATKPATARATKPAAAKRASARPRAAKVTPAALKPQATTAASPKPRATTPPSPKPRATTPAPPSPREPSPGVLETAVQAAAELTEIGLHAGARALRRVASRLPRP
jgi:demethylmenaquinone methyltransferase / 2-methoxy-6-polyprenyl-1,4-benzoquinol methylase